MRVDLPAPFSPTRPWTSPGMTAEIDILQRDDAGKALARYPASPGSERLDASPAAEAAMRNAIARYQFIIIILSYN